jgi:hypothetical protein
VRSADLVSPVDCPARAYDALNAAFGAWPDFVRKEDHEAGVHTDKPLGALVITNCRYVDADGNLLFRGRALRRVEERP